MKKHKTEKPVRPDKAVYRLWSGEEKLAYQESLKSWRSEVDYNIKDFTKTRGYIILSRNKKTGKVLGYVENSFSMSWTADRVKVYRPYYGYSKSPLTPADIGKARANLVKHLQADVSSLQAQYTGSDIFMARIGTKKCPVKIDWSSFYAEKNKRNYNYRNLLFNLK